MGVRGTGVRSVTRRGRRVLLIDFRYTDRAGVRQRFKRDATSQNMAAARAEADRLQRLAAETGSPVAARSSSLTLATWIEQVWRPKFAPTAFKPSTLERYEALLGQGLLDQLGPRRLDAIDGAAARAYLTTVAAKGAQTRPHHDFVRSLLKAAVETHHLEQLPGDLPKRPRRSKKLPDAPDVEEIMATLALAAGWLRVAIALGIMAGLRSCEIRALRAGDVDFRKGVLRIVVSMSAETETTTKGDSDRIVPITADLRPILIEACKSKLPGARVVVNRMGHTPRRQAVWDALDRLQSKHGLKHRSVHQLRHGWCTWLLRAGLDAESVRMLAGHTNLATTQRYVHADAERATAMMLGATTGSRSTKRNAEA